MNEPRVYKNSTTVLILILVFFVALLAAIFFGLESESWTTLIPVALLGVFILLSVFFIASSKVTLSEDGIIIRNLLGEKSLRWNEVNRVSGSGSRIKLHNFDEDVTLTPNPQLPGYEEIVEWIGRKRPDLFPPQDYSEMKRGFGFLLGMGVVALMFLGFLTMMAFQFLNSPDVPVALLAPMLITFIVLMIFLWFIFSAPQSLTLEGKSLTLKYLFGEKTLLADEIAAVHFAYTRTRNGKQYYISLQLTNRRNIRISGLGIGLPTAYLVLKNWLTSHK
ncbi:MAG TPA: PH domain-containing protein [Anaerolineales bacterium]|nr:PH domain-containing protein [Anaerolineales bacterium]HNN12422.1 PH domain-containing protein [Anaerolineales bacterium]